MASTFSIQNGHRGEQMYEHTILAIIWLLGFFVAVYGSIGWLMLGSLFLSFVVMLGAILMLFRVYEHLRDCLEASPIMSKKRD